MPEVVNIFGWQLTGDEARAAVFGGLFLFLALVAVAVSFLDAVLSAVTDEEFENGNSDDFSDRRIDHGVDGDVKAGE